MGTEAAREIVMATRRPFCLPFLPNAKATVHVNDGKTIIQVTAPRLGCFRNATSARQVSYS